MEEAAPGTMFVVEVGEYDETKEYYHSWTMLESFVYRSFAGAEKRLREWMEKDLKHLDKCFEIVGSSFKGTVYGTFVDYKYRGKTKRAQILPVFAKD